MAGSSNVYSSANVRITFNQTTASATWNINHGIGTMYPVVDVYVLENGSYTHFYSMGVSVVDSNNVTVTFSQPFAGYATVM